MKTLLALAASVLSCLLAPQALAQTTLTVTPFTQHATNYAVYIRSELPGAVFDAIQLDITPRPGITFTNLVSGTGGPSPTGWRQPNEPFTFRNRQLDADQIDGGKGWLIPPPVINANLLSFGVVNPTGKIDPSTEPNGRLFLANIQLTGQADPLQPAYVADAAAILVNNGVTVQELHVKILVIPEPGSGALAALAIPAILFRTRRVRTGH